MRSSGYIGSFVVTIFALTMTTAWGQSFPIRPMRLVVPYAPSGTIDWLGRVVSEQLSQRFKQSIIVENRAGGGAIIGMDIVARAVPDGYSLVVTSNTVAAVRVFNKDADFDPQKSLAPLSLAMRDTYVFWSHADVPARTLKEFIAYAKEQPGKLNIAAATNSVLHLDILRFINIANVKIVPIPYSGGPASVTALLTNEVQASLTPYPNFASHLKSGRVLALAVSSEKRFPLLPDVPTVRENGLDFEAGIWYAFFTSPGTPAPIVGKLSSEMADIVMRSPVTQMIRDRGLEPVGSTSEVLAKTLALEIARAQDVARKNGI